MENHFMMNVMNPRIVVKEVLLASSTPDEFICKVEEKQIIPIVKSFLDGGCSENIFVYGPTGSGKTSLMKHVIQHAQSYNSGIVCIQIDCFEYSTSMAICSRIADAIGEPVSRRGRATDETFLGIAQSLKSSKISLLIVLDEFDGLQDTRILHNIAKMQEEGIRICIICVSDHRSTLAKIPHQVRNRLTFSLIEVRGYTKNELFFLLKERASQGLLDGAYNDSILQLIADIGAKNNGNGKLALQILRKAARLADTKGLSKISEFEVRETATKMQIWVQRFSEYEQILIEMIINGEKTTPELYSEFAGRADLSTRQIRNLLHSLEKKGVVEFELVKVGDCIKHSVVRLSEGFI